MPHNAATGPLWGVLKADGTFVRKAGPAEGAVAIFAEAVAAVVFHQGRPPLYIAGPVDLLWTVTKALGSTTEDRAWGLAVPTGSRVWLLGGGAAYGIGPTIEAVEEAAGMLQNAERLEKHGRHRQGRTGTG